MATVTSMSINGVSNTEREVYVTFKWSKSHTDKFEIDWEYSTGQIVSGALRWYVDDWSTHDPQITQGRYTYRYTAPDNAIAVRVWVRPVAAKDSKGKAYWTASWSGAKVYYFTYRCPTPSLAASMSADCRKATLTASGYSTDTYADQFQFRWLRSVDGGSWKKWKESSISRTSGWEPATSTTVYDTSVEPGHSYSYKVQSNVSKPASSAFVGRWSELSDEAGLETFPSKVSGLSASAASPTAVTLSWAAVANAEAYAVECSTSEQAWKQAAEGDITRVDGVAGTKHTVTGLATGQRWFFRVSATNSVSEGEPSDAASLVIGTVPDAPTPYATETAYMRGEQVYLRWVHNSEDGSAQQAAQLQWTDDGGLAWTSVTLAGDSFYMLDTDGLADAASVQWRVRTKGVLDSYGPWSGASRFSVYAQPTLSAALFQGGPDGEPVGGESAPLAALPLYISLESESDAQSPVSYEAAIKALDPYPYLNQRGETVWMPAGATVWSAHVDAAGQRSAGISVGASDAALVPGASYAVVSSAAMDSGLRTPDAEVGFVCEWSSDTPQPAALVEVDGQAMTATVVPYCPALDDDGAETGSMRDGVSLAVWRVGSDGSMTLLGEGVANDGSSAVFDPHPAFGTSTYRVVATDEATGAVGCGDELAELPVESIVIQWGEEWRSVEPDPARGGEWEANVVSLPYNIRISEDASPDVELREYAGRSHPVSYYGTQLGVKGSWSASVVRGLDDETVAQLRRLAVWLGDAYVREPSGAGYWADVQVSLSQSCDTRLVDVALSVTRVDRGDA